MNIVGRAVHGADGQVVEFVGAVRDVTEQRLAEDALHEARAELAHVARANTVGALTASIAHEVNQPLSGIVTNANTCLRLLAEDPPNVAHARETAQRTIRDANRAAEVIARLRALFRKRRIVTEPLDLNEVVNEVIALTRSEVRRGGVVLREELATALPHVFGDRVQLQQVLLNLILNALEATSTVTDRPRELCIRTHARDEHVEIGVQDNGVGLHGRDPEKIFEPFVTSKEGGMGMGLSISRSIVERHGGRIWAASRSEHGAELVFVLPASTAAPAPRDRAT